MSKQDTTAILKRIRRTIEAHLGPERGFALLTFPFGPAVDPLIHYASNTADKKGVVAMMEHWCRCQRQGEFSQANDEAKAVTWITERPTVEGLFLLKASVMPDPEFVKLTLCDGDLRLSHWVGDQWEETADFVRDLDPAKHLWLGPIAEPWKSPDAINRGEVILTPTTIAEHHMPYFNTMAADYVAGMAARTNTPEEPIPDFVANLVNAALAHGYAQGIAQQLNRPAY